MLPSAKVRENRWHNMKIAQARKHLIENPLDAQALCQLGLAYAKEGRLDKAIDFVSQAAASDTTQPSLHCALGDVLREAERVVEAACAYRQALQIDPKHVPSLNGLGLVGVDRKEADLAVACLRRAVELAPDDFVTRCHLARALNHERAFAEARVESRISLKLNPDCAAAHFHLAASLAGLGRLKASIGVLRRFQAIQPACAEVYGLMVQTFNNLNFSDEAAAFCQQGLSLTPNDPRLHFEWGVYALAAGDWETGWREYEWRFQLPGQRTDHIRLSQPLGGPAWRGENLEGKTLFVHCEQGLGDTLWFIRFLPELAKLNCRLVALVQPELVGLLQCLANLARVIPFRAPNPPHDYQIPLHSVPRVLGTRLENLPCQVPYLEPVPKGV
jgi:Flp pilus assembly protein TadD